jgi:light-regulated signal transduction histidine kinase (bacteriophytochrome)
VDLSTCDRELVHMPGLIQPHGVMLVLRQSDLAILQASENTADLLGVPALDLTSKGLADLLGSEQQAALGAAIACAGDRLDRSPTHLLQVPPAEGRVAFDAIAHKAGDVLILELEQVMTTRSETCDPYAGLADCIAGLCRATNLQEFLDVAVTQVRAFTGFDRVMAYRFDEDGSGEVMAEARRDGLNPYCGQHFPASDIPAPARRLFALSRLRHLPDAAYTPVRLLPESGAPVDMSRSILRHVSVMYSSYLKNMRTHATMVLPLMKGGQLWGLMSCMHHAGPFHVPCTTRTAIEILSHTVSSMMAEREDGDTATYRARMSEAIAGLDRQMNEEPDFRHGLSRGDITVHGWLDATGAAVATEDGLVLLGTTPDESEVRGIVAWLDRSGLARPEYATNCLPQVYPPAAAFKATACGLLAARLMQGRPEFVLWFRPERVQTVAWAGDPHKPVQVDVSDGAQRLTPRTHFEPWKEELRARSAAWLPCEIEAAGALRRAIVEVALRRLNDDLRRSNTELDNFAYIASHDLKEPLRGIHNFANFLQCSADAKLTEEERGRIQTILNLTQRMDDLTDALLQYSRVGQTELVFETVDMNEPVRQVLELLGPQIAAAGIEVRLPRPFPKIRTDNVRLVAVLTNLVVNAIKYTDRSAGERRIELGWRHQDGRRLFYVRDTGIGIAERHLEEIFRIFRRLHPQDEYGGGNGAGLTIARRAIERFGGRLWAESDGLGKGATFLFSLGEASIADPSA